MMPAATVSLVVPSITSNVYAMYILSNHYLCVYLFLVLLLLFLVCFTVYLSAAFIDWFYVYFAVMSVLNRDKFQNFIVATVKNYLILSILLVCCPHLTGRPSKNCSFKFQDCRSSTKLYTIQSPSPCQTTLHVYSPH